MKVAKNSGATLRDEKLKPGDLLTWRDPPETGPKTFVLLEFGENILGEPNFQELICLVDGKIRSIDRFYCTLLSRSDQ
jgi:hypothetical protein